MAIKLGGVQRGRLATGEAEAGVQIQRGPRRGADLGEANAIRALGSALGQVGNVVAKVGRGREVRTAKGRADDANSETKRQLGLEFNSMLPSMLGKDTAEQSDIWSARSLEIVAEGAASAGIEEGSLASDYYRAGLTTTIDGYNSSLVTTLTNAEIAKVQQVWGTQEEFDTDFVTREALSDNILDIHTGLVQEFTDKMAVDAENPLNQGIFVGEGNSLAERADGYSERLGMAILNARVLADPADAQEALDALRPVLSPEAIAGMEVDIAKQEKIQSDRIEAQRKTTAEAFSKQILDQSLSGTVTTTQLQTSPEWNFLTLKEQEHLLSISEKSSPFNESDPVILAQVSSLVNTDPEAITQDDFDAFHGEGLSTADYNIWLPKWQAKIKEIEENRAEDPLQDGFEKQAYLLIDRMRKDTAFIEPGGFLIGQTPEELQENDLLAAQQVNSLSRYIEDHPGEDYVETYIKPVLKPVQEGFVSSTYDKATAFFTDEPFVAVEADVEIRRQAADLLTAQGQAVTRESINRVSAQIREGDTELKILTEEEAQRLFDAAPGNTNEEKAEAARRNAIGLGFIVP